MKTFNMNLQPALFDQVKNGTKQYELRLYDDKRRAVAIGDEIVFDCRDEICRCRVTGLVIAPTFRDLLDMVPVHLCGLDENNAMTVLETFYPIEKQMQYNVIAIRVHRI